MATVLVTDGEQRSALAAVRSLGRAGHAVEVCSADGASLAGASRHAEADHPVTAPASDPGVFAGEVAAVASRAAADVVLPATEASMLALLPRRRDLDDAVIPFGDVDAFRALSDKDRVHGLAGEAGLAVPEQVVVASPGEGGPVDLGWPVVVKPSRSVHEEGGGLRKEGVVYARSPEELSARLGELSSSAYPVLLQRRIEGRGTGIFLLRWGGRTRAVFAHRRLREKPPSGGVSVYREAVDADPDLVRRCELLVDSVGWNGVAMVEFKEDADTGTPYVMEVNARLWGSLQLAVDAGVDFPRLLVEAALGDAYRQPPSYRAGVRSRWWWGDVDHVIARLRGDGPVETGGAGAGRLRAVTAFLLLWRPGDRYEVLRADDPGPFLRETAQWLREAAAAAEAG